MSQDLQSLLRMLANRARSFPNFGMGYHMPELFDALGEEPPQPAAWAVPANPLQALCSVEQARGYVAFGAGVYKVTQTREPGLVVTFRGDDEAHYGVGDRAAAPDQTPIPAENIIVRLEFTSAASLDSLEAQLREIRAEHWPESALSPAPSQARAALSKPVAQEAVNLHRSTFVALQALTEGILTRGEPEYMRRCLDECVAIMGAHGWLAPTPWPLQESLIATFATTTPADAVKGGV